MLLELYKAYMTTKSEEALVNLVLSPYTYYVIRQNEKLNTNYQDKSLFLEQDEIISLLYIRLKQFLHKKDFQNEQALKGYLKTTITGFILDASTKDRFRKNAVLTDRIEDYTEHYEEDRLLIEYPQIEAYFKQYPYLKDYCFNCKSLREVMREQHLSYNTLKQQLNHLKTLVS